MRGCNIGSKNKKKLLNVKMAHVQASGSWCATEIKNFIDEKPSVREKEKTKKREKKEKTTVAICLFLLRKRAMVIK